MARKPASPAVPAPSTTKTCALAVFRLIRRVQMTVEAVPGVLQEARDDIAAAWRESGRRRFKA